MDFRVWSVGSCFGSGTGDIHARNQEVPEGGSRGEPIHQGGASVRGGDSKVARQKDV